MFNLPDLNNLVSLLSVGIMWAIVQPLKEAIRALQKSIDKLTEKTEGNTSEISHVREKVLVHENSLKTLFKKTWDCWKDAVKTVLKERSDSNEKIA